MTHENTKPKEIEDDEIDLIALAKTLWNNRRTIIKITLIFGAIGLFIAIVSPKEFTATTTMVPQSSDSQSKLGGLSGLAAMAGINLSMGNGSELSPLIYPQIVSSIPFQMELMDKHLQFETIEDTVTLFDYFTKYQKKSVPGTLKKYTIGLPGTILKAIKGEKQETIQFKSGKRILKLTEEQTGIQKKISELVSIAINDNDGYITLSCIMPEPLAAAQLAETTQELLQRYITEFKIEKAKSNHDFIQQRYDEAKKNYQVTQEKLANFRDRNKNVSTAIAKTEEDRLTGEYTLAYSVYSELAKQLEQAKIRLKEDTPVFTIIEPVTVPTEKSKPNRPIILIIWIFLGGIISIGWIFGKQFLANTIIKWKEEPIKQI
jgi:uncharacterized protein involved in exopolysaccharide biosynthesis